MIATGFSVLIRLELSAPGTQFLQGDHQLYNGAPFNYTVRGVNKITQGQPVPDWARLLDYLSLKASTLASSGQPSGENSTVEKLSERMSASYNSHDEDNESLQLFTLV